MSAFADFTSPSTVQKYAMYWRVLFTEPRALIGQGASDAAALKASDAVVFSLFNLTLAVVLQDRLLFMINALSVDAVAVKVATYLLLSLVFWALAFFCYPRGHAAAWAAGLTASSASCALATMALTAIFIALLAVTRFSGAAPIDFDFGGGVLWLDAKGEPLSVAGANVSNLLLYHAALFIAVLVIGLPTIWRTATRKIIATLIFMPLFAIFALASLALSMAQGDSGGVMIPMAAEPPMSERPLMPPMAP